VVSFGETKPLVQTPDRERLNRRTVTEIVGFARGYIGEDMDGKRALIVYNEYVQDAGTEIVLNAEAAQ
jgi:peptidoglycan-associated lipoprotein